MVASRWTRDPSDHSLSVAWWQLCAQCFQNKHYTAPVWPYVSSERPHSVDAPVVADGLLYSALPTVHYIVEPTAEALPIYPSYDIDNLNHFHANLDAIHRTLLALNVHKACGPDGLSARILFECVDEFAVPLTKICALSLNPPAPPGEDRIRPPLGFSEIASSFITVSTWNLAHLSGHQFGVVSCKENQNRPKFFCYRSNFVTSLHAILGR